MRVSPKGLNMNSLGVLEVGVRQPPTGLNKIENHRPNSITNVKVPIKRIVGLLNSITTVQVPIKCSIGMPISFGMRPTTLLLGQAANADAQMVTAGYKKIRDLN